MRIKKLEFGPERSNSDEKILAHIRENDTRAEILNWFFEHARNYAQAYLAKSYPDIEKLEWDLIFANVNLKFVTRVKKGLQLQPDTRLTTYYTSLAKFAALDFLQNRKSQQQYQVVEEHQVIEVPIIENEINRKERAKEIESWLVRIIGNKDQVTVLLLQAEGYTFKEIVQETGYQSEGACRNASVKGKKKVVDYLVKHPAEVKALRRLLQSN